MSQLLIGAQIALTAVVVAALLCWICYLFFWAEQRDVRRLARFHRQFTEGLSRRGLAVSHEMEEKSRYWMRSISRVVIYEGVSLIIDTAYGSDRQEMRVLCEFPSIGSDLEEYTLSSRIETAIERKFNLPLRYSPSALKNKDPEILVGKVTEVTKEIDTLWHATLPHSIRMQVAIEAFQKEAHEVEESLAHLVGPSLLLRV